MPPKRAARARTREESEATDVPVVAAVNESAPGTASQRLGQCAAAIALVLTHTSASAAGHADAASDPFAEDPNALFAPREKQQRWVNVEVSFLRAPVPNRVPITVALSNPIHDRANICVVTPQPASDFTKQLVEDDNAPANVTRIIDEVTLAAKFTEPVARRGLAKAFDAFFIHGALKQYPALLTGEFLSWRTPVWMPRPAKDATFSHQLREAMKLAVIPRRGFQNVTVTIGHSGQSKEALTANAVALLDGLVAHLEAGWQDVLSVRVGAANGAGKSLVLPIYAHNFVESHGLPKAETAASQETAPVKVSPAPTPKRGGRRKEE